MILSRMLLVAGTVTVVACGPRLKPVEYEEPKGSGSANYDDSEGSSSSSSSRKKSSSMDSDTSSSSSSSSSGKSGPFKSCDEKANTCGAPCTECAPGDMDCMEVLVQKQCNAEHKCVAAPVDCTVADKDKKKAKKE